MNTFEITPARRRWLHQRLEEALNAMEERQDLHGGFSEILVPAHTSVRGARIEVNLSLRLTPIDKQGNKIPAALFKLPEPSGCCGKGPYAD